jgi:hypothetical protein
MRAVMMMTMMLMVAILKMRAVLVMITTRAVAMK